MKEIPLVNGGVALVDDCDFDALSQYQWRNNGCGYVSRSAKVDGKWKQILMHRVICEPQERQEVDHINLNRHDNRRENLRVCSHADNSKNQPIYKNNRVGIKGVYRDPRKGGKSYRAQITVDGKQMTLGIYATPEEAGEAYRKAAIRYHGEFARFK